MTFSHLRAYHFILFYFSGKTSKKCQFKKRHAMYCKLPWKNPCSLRPFCPPNSHASFLFFSSFLSFFPNACVTSHGPPWQDNSEGEDTVRYSTSGIYRYVESNFPTSCLPFHYYLADEWVNERMPRGREREGECLI